MSYGRSSPGFVLYVDEAGDDGIRPTIRHKSASDWFILGGVALLANEDSSLLRTINEAGGKLGFPLGRDIHFVKLNDNKRRIICSELSNGNYRWFCVASHKENMRGHRNQNAQRISNKENPLYNFMLRILLERVTRYSKSYNDKAGYDSSPSDLKVFLSDRGGLRPSEIASYFSRLWLQSKSGTTFLTRGMVDFSVFTPRNFYVRRNSELAGLQVADVIVSSLYKALPGDGLSNRSSEYIQILAQRCAQMGGSSIDSGLTILPFDWKKTLRTDAQDVFYSIAKLSASPRLCDPTKS